MDFFNDIKSDYVGGIKKERWWETPPEESSYAGVSGRFVGGVSEVTKEQAQFVPKVNKVI